MTTEQARRMTADAEQEIVAKHTALCTLADSAENEAAAEASSTVTKKTMLPLLIMVVVGVIFIAAGSVFLGILSMAGGIFLARRGHVSAKDAEAKVTNLRNNYRNAINSNRTI